MKSFIFGQSEINISHMVFERGVKACLSLKELTRPALSEASGINSGYSGKILSTLTECKFLLEDSSVSPYGYSISPYLSILVLDLSSTPWSIYVVNGNGECILGKKNEINEEISFTDKLHSVLSRFGPLAKSLPCGISAICVLNNDEKTEVSMQREIIDGTFASVFGMIPLIYVSIGEAISSLLDFNLCPAPKNGRFAYIRLAEDITALYLSEDKKVAYCNPARLIVNREQTVRELYNDACSSFDIGIITSRIMSAIDFTLEMGTYIIESDRFKIDVEAIDVIKHTYAITGSFLPEIYTSSLSLPYPIAAAAKLTTTKLIMTLIKAK